MGLFKNNTPTNPRPSRDQRAKDKHDEIVAMLGRHKEASRKHIAERRAAAEAKKNGGKK